MTIHLTYAGSVVAVKRGTAKPETRACAGPGLAYSIMRFLLASGDLQRRYEPTEIPPCRVCGGALHLSSCGGGEPSRWACREATTDRRTDWDHYNSSCFTDYRRADPDVIEALRLLAALADGADALRALVEAIERGDATDGMMPLVLAARDVLG